MKKTIVLAGANGFMGSCFLAEALKKRIRVYALSRASKELTADERVRREMSQYMTKQELEKYGKYLEVYEYDISQPCLGLDDDVVEEMTARVTDVFNFVGDTTFFPKDLKRFFVTNVDSPQHLIERLCLKGAWFHHVSTAYVAGKRNGRVLESELDEGQDFFNDYEKSKNDGEKRVREVCARYDVPFTIFRPSIVVRSRMIAGKSPNLNHFYTVVGLIQILRQDAMNAGDVTEDEVLEVPLRILGDKNGFLNFVDLDYAVQATLHIGLESRKKNTTYHLVNRKPLTNQGFIEALMSLYNITGFKWVKDKKALTHPTFRERLVKRGMANYIDYCYGKIDFDDAHTRKALVGTGIDSPAFTKEYIGRATGVIV